MAVEVYIPKFGQTVEEVTLLQWMADDGAAVKKGQEVLEIETDKTTFFVEAEGAGTLHRGPFEPGKVVPVLTIVATIGAPDEKFVGGMIQGEDETEVKAETQAKVEVEVPSASTLTSKVFASPRARKLAATEHVDLAAMTPTGGGGVRVVERDVQAYVASAPKATPLAEKLAAEAGIDLRKLAGTGPGGKITKEDVEAAVKAVVPAPVAAPTQPQLPASSFQLPTSNLQPPISNLQPSSLCCASSANSARRTWSARGRTACT